MTRMEAVQADLTQQTVDAVVNAANSQLQHGGGVALALARAAGPQLQRESRTQAPVPTGSAAVTGAGQLPCRWVIHAVGPIWQGGQAGEPQLLQSAYRAAGEQAVQLGARSLALPSISTGIYGFPITLAAPIAIQAMQEFPRLELVRFCLWSPEDLRVFQAALRASPPAGSDQTA